MHHLHYLGAPLYGSIASNYPYKYYTFMGSRKISNSILHLQKINIFIPRLFKIWHSRAVLTVVWGRRQWRYFGLWFVITGTVPAQRNRSLWIKKLNCTQSIYTPQCNLNCSLINKFIIVRSQCNDPMKVSSGHVVTLDIVNRLCHLILTLVRGMQPKDFTKVRFIP